MVGRHVMKLTNNMHLNTDVQAERDFSKWQLEVGHGQHTDDLGKLLFLITLSALRTLLPP